ncbi:hypothetical protein JYB87_15870 [Shewanella avicenniae]|uniref:Membrane-anchored protein n=1 Tax=Shewanella avicenniae TaxID=2814294 RepID=A0ABX7QNY0_9GAMM|nr:hypothetical protein [Shewanella avicenniae]QSX33182.1 hypothetical protein JYB87_15870 [Shewanella avicenniae]
MKFSHSICALFTLLSCSTFAANDTQSLPVCPTTSHQLSHNDTFGVQYQLSGAQHGTLQLLRSQAQTAYYNPENGVAEWWNFAIADHPSFIRVFAKHQRRIDYYTGDLRTLNIKVSQAEMESFATAQLLKQLSHKGPATCDGSQVYEGDVKQMHYRVIWSDELGLPLELSITHNGQTKQWQAQKLIPANEVELTLSRWQQFSDTDYADIGDNETDPFLAQMINQGFVEHSEHAVYDSKGKPMHGEHIH